jgi:hypothetical protein
LNAQLESSESGGFPKNGGALTVRVGFAPPLYMLNDVENPRQKPGELQTLATILGPAIGENTQVADCTKFSDSAPQTKLMV